MSFEGVWFFVAGGMALLQNPRVPCVSSLGLALDHITLFLPAIRPGPSEDLSCPASFRVRGVVEEVALWVGSMPPAGPPHW